MFFYNIKLVFTIIKGYSCSTAAKLLHVARVSILNRKCTSHLDPQFSGKYAMRDLVQKLPSGNQQHDHGTSDDTIAAVLATLNEVIKKHPEFSR